MWSKWQSKRFEKVVKNGKMAMEKKYGQGLKRYGANLKKTRQEIGKGDDSGKINGQIEKM